MVLVSLTHLRLETHKRDNYKQCRTRSDAAKCGVWSGSTLFAFNTWISIKHGNIKTTQTPLLLQMDLSKELRLKSPFGINVLTGFILCLCFVWIFALLLPSDMSQRTTKSTIKLDWPTKTQINLYIHPVWQGFSFNPLWIVRRLKKAHAVSADSDQTADRTNLIVGFVVPKRWTIFQPFCNVLHYFEFLFAFLHNILLIKRDLL